MTAQFGPNRNSVLYRALLVVFEKGGAIDKARLGYELLSHFRSATKLDRDILAPLKDFYGYVTVDGESVSLTRAGRAFLKADGHVVNTELNTSVAGERYEAPVRALNISKHQIQRPIRPGSEDYKKHPSLVGNQRIPYRFNEE